MGATWSLAVEEQFYLTVPLRGEASVIAVGELVEHGFGPAGRGWRQFKDLAAATCARASAEGRGIQVAAGIDGQAAVEFQPISSLRGLVDDPSVQLPEDVGESSKMPPAPLAPPTATPYKLPD